MSVQAMAMNMVLRTVVKTRLRMAVHPIQGRKVFDLVKLISPRVPRAIRVEEINEPMVKGQWVKPTAVDETKVVYYVHGGGYFWGSPDTHRDLTWRLARKAGTALFAVDYRLAPEHSFPAALEDVVQGYEWLLAQGYRACDIAIAGDSAGGGLCLALMLALKDKGIALPSSALVMSPWTDLAGTGDSMKKNARLDPMFPPKPVREVTEFYLDGADPTHPYASPLYGDVKGLPPVMIQVGSTEVLLDDSRRMAKKLQEAGVNTKIEIWPRMPHVWQAMASVIPEGRKALRHSGAFLRAHIDAAVAAETAAQAKTVAHEAQAAAPVVEPETAKGFPDLVGSLAARLAGRTISEAPRSVS